MRIGWERDRLPDRERFLAEHRAWVFRCALSMVGCREAAEDIAQDALIKGFRQRGQLADGAKEKAWMRSIVVRSSINFLALRKFTNLSVEIAAADSDPTQSLAVRQTLEKLPPDQRVILSLSIAEQLSYEEIAEALGIPPGTVASRIHHAKAAFRRLWPT